MAKSHIVSAIDIGSTKISTLVAQVSEENSIHVVGVATVSSKGIKKGQIVNIEEASAGILESVEVAERMAGYNVAEVFVGMGGAQIQSQNSTGVVAVATGNGEISDDDVQRVMEAAKAVSLPTGQEIIHVLPRTFTVDGQEGVKDPVGMTGIRLEVDTHIISGSATALKNLTKCVSEVGSDISGVVFSGLASSLSCLTETEKELGVVLIDIGGGTTSIAVYSDGALCLSSVLPIGARHITNDLAIGLRISLESAEKIKLIISDKKRAKIDPDEVNDAVKDKGKEDDLDLSHLNLPEEVKSISKKTVVEGIIKPRLNEIANEVGKELKKNSLAGITPAGVVITGGGALTVGTVECFRRSLAMPVRIGFPTGVTGLVDDITNPQYSTSVGLLIYGSHYASSQGRKSHLPGKLGNTLQSFPLKNLAVKAIDLIKSILP